MTRVPDGPVQGAISTSGNHDKGIWRQFERTIGGGQCSEMHACC